MAYRTKRYGYGSRRTRRKYRRRSRLRSRRSSVLQKCLNVYHNPFSRSTYDCRLPDGENQLSRGYRFQHVKELNPGSTGSYIEVFLFPGYVAYAAVRTESSSEPTITHVVGAKGLVDMQLSNNGTTSNNSLQRIDFAHSTKEIDQWRLVSLGAQFALVNNADENDGWWEACRLQLAGDNGPSIVLEDGQDATGRMDPNGGIKRGFVVPHIPEQSELTDIAVQPSYCTGKLRDLHRYRFETTPVKNEYPNRRTMSPAAEATAIGTTYSNMSLPLFLDTTHDMIYIKIHGRQPATGSATKVVMHTAANYEVCHPRTIDAGGASLMTRPPFLNQAGWSREMRKRQRKIPAATIKRRL